MYLCFFYFCLDHHGTNHGIELNKDCLDYAYEKLEEFKQKSLALDEFDFCEPVFMHGKNICLKYKIIIYEVLIIFRYLTIIIS